MDRKTQVSLEYIIIIGGIVILAAAIYFILKGFGMEARDQNVNTLFTLFGIFGQEIGGWHFFSAAFRTELGVSCTNCSLHDVWVSYENLSAVPGFPSTVLAESVRVFVDNQKDLSSQTTVYSSDETFGPGDVIVVSGVELSNGSEVNVFIYYDTPSTFDSYDEGRGAPTSTGTPPTKDPHVVVFVKKHAMKPRGAQNMVFAYSDCSYVTMTFKVGLFDTKTGTTSDLFPGSTDLYIPFGTFDIDGDGDYDEIGLYNASGQLAQSYDRASGKSLVLLNLSSPPFQIYSPLHVRVGDPNGDGKMDYVFGAEEALFFYGVEGSASSGTITQYGMVNISEKDPGGSIISLWSRGENKIPFALANVDGDPQDEIIMVKNGSSETEKLLVAYDYVEDSFASQTVTQYWNNKTFFIVEGISAGAGVESILAFNATNYTGLMASGTSLDVLDWETGEVTHSIPGGFWNWALVDIDGDGFEEVYYVDISESGNPRGDLKLYDPSDDSVLDTGVDACVFGVGGG